MIKKKRKKINSKKKKNNNTALTCSTALVCVYECARTLRVCTVRVMMWTSAAAVRTRFATCEAHGTVRQWGTTVTSSSSSAANIDNKLTTDDYNGYDDYDLRWRARVNSLITIDDVTCPCTPHSYYIRPTHDLMANNRTQNRLYRIRL